MSKKILIDGLYHDIGEPTIYDDSNTITITLKHGISKIAGQAIYASDILKYILVPFEPKKRIVIDWIKNTRNIKAGIITEVR